jgi:hypothetical protein
MNHSPMQLFARCGRLAAALLMTALLQLAASQAEAAGGSGNSGWWSMGGGASRGGWSGGGMGSRPSWSGGGWNGGGSWNGGAGRPANWTNNGNWNNGSWNNGGWNHGGWNNGGWNGGWNHGGWNHGWWNGGWHGGGWWHNGWHGGWWGWGYPGWCCSGWGSSVSFFFGFPVAYPYYVYPVAAPESPPVTEVQPAATPGPAPQQSWYFCSNPKGYYPYVQNCSSGWTSVPVTPPGVSP